MARAVLTAIGLLVAVGHVSAQVAIRQAIELSPGAPRSVTAAGLRLASDGERFLGGWQSGTIVYLQLLDEEGNALTPRPAIVARCSHYDVAWSGGHWLVACGRYDEPVEVLRLAADLATVEVAARIDALAAFSLQGLELDCGAGRCALAASDASVLRIASLAPDGSLSDVREIASARVGIRDYDLCAGETTMLVVAADGDTTVARRIGSDGTVTHEHSLGGGVVRCAARGDAFALVSTAMFRVVATDGSLGPALDLPEASTGAGVAANETGWTITVAQASRLPVVARTVTDAGAFGPAVVLSTIGAPSIDAPRTACLGTACLTLFRADTAGVGYVRAHDGLAALGSNERAMSVAPPDVWRHSVASNGCEATLQWTGELADVPPTRVATVDLRGTLPRVVVGDPVGERWILARGPRASLWRSATEVSMEIDDVQAAVSWPTDVPWDLRAVVLGDGFGADGTEGIFTSFQRFVWEVSWEGGAPSATERFADVSRGGAMEGEASNGEVMAVVSSGDPPELRFVRPGRAAEGPWPLPDGLELRDRGGAIACQRASCLVAGWVDEEVAVTEAEVGDGPGALRRLGMTGVSHVELVAVGTGYLLAANRTLLVLDLHGEPVGDPVYVAQASLGPVPIALDALDGSRALAWSTDLDGALHARVVEVGTSGEPALCPDIAADAGSEAARDPAHCACHAAAPGPAPRWLLSLGPLLVIVRRFGRRRARPKAL